MKGNVDIYQKDGKWICRAKTGNWAGDIYWFEAETREALIKKAIAGIKEDGEELWLLNDPLLQLKENDETI